MDKKSSQDLDRVEPINRAPSVSKGSIIDADDRRLRAQGHKAELERSFSWLGALSLAYSISNSWLTYASSFGLVLIYGGGVTTLFALLIAAAAQWIVFLGLAELCSAFPSSGGQHHFTYIVASPKIRNFGAYVTGSINILAWWIITCSGLIYTAISAFGCAAAWFPDFAQQRYQVYLCYLGITVLSRWLLSIAAALYCFAANGAVTHIAEELPNPGRKLPQVLNMSMAMGIVIIIPWTVTMLYSIKDMDAVQSSFLPSFKVFYQATRSKAAATGLQAYLTLLYYTCIPSQWVTCSHITWAFARDARLPFAEYWQHINPKRGIPWRTTLLSAAFCALYGLIYIASTTAFNSIINATCLMLNLSYVIPQGVLLTQGRGMLPRRAFNLGKLGYAVNLYSVVFMIVIGVVFCLPQTSPTTASSMTYNAPVVVGLYTIVCLLWIERRSKFNGPHIDWDLLNEANEEE
ncbi:HNM1-choline permease [Fusarium phyllophilum]|uniref:HNM1-choline permease n=1 Tax=Fusarium phyllophilum TaxID=47803 RepID=A0A8H5KCW0_9HYPO|nr:HNM1-choline permease [Fusarium phyllophilum]